VQQKNKTGSVARLRICMMEMMRDQQKYGQMAQQAHQLPHLVNQNRVEQQTWSLTPLIEPVHK